MKIPSSTYQRFWWRQKGFGHGEARRLIDGGGIKINQQTIQQRPIRLGRSEKALLQAGKALGSARLIGSATSNKETYICGDSLLLAVAAYWFFVIPDIFFSCSWH